MDTERDENQNLMSNIETDRDNSPGNYRTKENFDFDNGEFNPDLPDDDYTNDQNNSSTGYTEKLLEKNFDQEQRDKESDAESEFESDDDLIVKNGNIATDNVSLTSDSSQIGNDNKNDSLDRTDK